MRKLKTITTFAAAVVVAVPILTGAAQARTVVIGGYTGETITPTRDFYESGLKSEGPGKFKIRDAKTGKLVRKGKTDTKSGKYRGSKGEDVNIGTVDLPPGEYRVEVWQTDPRGNRYKAESKLSIKKNEGRSIVILELEKQSKSEVALDQAAAIKDRIDFLKYAHDHALAAAVIAKNKKEFDNATSYAQEIFDEMNAEWLKYMDKRQEAARFAAQEKKAKTKVAGDDKPKTGTQKATPPKTETPKSGTRKADTPKTGTPSGGQKRAMYENEKSQLQHARGSQTSRIAAYKPTFLKRRAALLSQIPDPIRARLETGGGTDPAGRAAVKYTRLKIDIERAGAPRSSRSALSRLGALYDHMMGLYSAVLATDARSAHVDKEIAHTIVDETAYAVGGYEGGDGGESGGNGGGGHP